MTEVLGWTADDSACGHYRMIWPFQVLRTEGLRARQTRELTGEAMLEADLTIVQRVSTVEATQLVELVAKEGGRLAYECDDLLWALDPSNAAYSQFNDRHVQRRIARAVESCAAVIVSTAELAHEFMERWDLPTYVLPNCVPDYMARIAPRGPRSSVSSPVIGWAGSPTHGGDMIQDASYGLRRALQSGGTFRSMGADYRKALRVEGDFIPWDTDITAYHLSLGQFDIGICPLERTRFNRSKSPIKAMEYQAAGVVPVATDCHAYRDVIEHGVTGFLCSTQKQWADALRTLVNDDDVREQMSAACSALTPSRTYGAQSQLWADSVRAIAAI